MLIQEGYLIEQCERCGYNERRNLDLKVPLILHYRDGNQKNFRLENIHLLCYNCYFHAVGDQFTQNQIKALEQYDFMYAKNVDLDLEEPFHAQFNSSIGLGRGEINQNPAELSEYKDVEKKITEEDIADELEKRDEDFGLDLVSFLKK